MEDRTKLMVEEVYGVPSGLDAATKRKIGTETLNAIGNWFNNTAYGKRFKAGQERQAALEQTLKDQGGPMALYLKLKSQPNQLEQQILEGISNLPNLIGQPGIDRRISDPLTYLALSGGLRGTARGIRNVASNPRAMQGLKNINPLAPASQKVVNVKGQTIHGPGITAESSRTISEKYPFLVKGKQSTVATTDLTKIKQGQPYAMAYEGTGKREVDPYIFRSGSKKNLDGITDGTALKQQFSGDLMDIFLKQKQQGITEHSRGSAIKEFKDFRTNTAVKTDKGVPKRFTGIKSAVQLMEKLDSQGKLDKSSVAQIAETLSWGGVEKSSSTKERLLKEQYPEDEGRAYAKVVHGLKPDEIDQVMKLWSKHSKTGFGRIREVARQRSLTPADLSKELLHGERVAFDDRLPGGVDEDAGHFIPAKYRIDHPDKEKLRAILEQEGVELDRLADPATSALTGMSEKRLSNIAGSNKPEHAMHTKLAQLMDIPTNWAEDLDYVIRLYKGEDITDWKEQYPPKLIEKALKFDTFASEEAAIEFFKKEIEPFKFKPDTKNIQRQEKYSRTDEWRDPDYTSTDELEGPMTEAQKKAYDKEMGLQSWTKQDALKYWATA